jgi:hypothetical protein
MHAWVAVLWQESNGMSTRLPSTPNWSPTSILYDVCASTQDGALDSTAALGSNGPPQAGYGARQRVATCQHG